MAITRKYNDTGEDPMANADHTDAVAALALRAAHIAEPDDADVLVGHAERLATLDLEQYRDRPRRPQGTGHAADVASFNNLVSRWDTGIEGDLNVYANSGRDEIFSITAVLNDHNAGLPGWGDHKVVHVPVLADKFRRWSQAIVGGAIEQREFAELIEDSLDILAEPAAADLLDVAANFASTTTVRFSSVVNLRDGRHELAYSEEEETDAGKAGNVTVPDKIVLFAPIYRHGPSEKIELGLRYRTHGGKLSIALRMLDPDTVWDTANANYLDLLDDDLTVINGAPRGA